MKLVSSNKKWRRFEKKSLEPGHARVPLQPLQIHAQKDECRDWGPSNELFICSSLHISSQ